GTRLLIQNNLADLEKFGFEAEGVGVPRAVKTSSVVVWLSAEWPRLLGRNRITLCSRRISCFH
ncbi:MAG TPA: hypothetical protein VHP35_10630, partial [Terriglobia bacterium]|nr:hypothetical protein [Terriglobia bacterium]